jgi:hypothetical protein
MMMNPFIAILKNHNAEAMRMVIAIFERKFVQSAVPIAR